MPDANTDKSKVDITKQVAKRNRQEMDDLDDENRSSDLNVDIRTMLTSLSNKIDSLNSTMSGNDIRINNKIDNLEVSLSNKIKEVKDEVEHRIHSITEDFGLRLDKATLEMNDVCDNKVSIAFKGLTVRLDEMQAHNESRMDRLDRFSLDKDLVISGVPMDNKDEPFAIVGDICGALNCNLKQGDFVSAFRIKSKQTNSKSKPPIVVKVQDEWVKQQLLTAYFKKNNLNLTDIGFKTPSRIFINERLTATNRAIFNRAAEAKKNNYVFRYYTRRGLVHIQLFENMKPSCIFHINELDRLFPLHHGSSSSSNVRGISNPLQQSENPLAGMPNQQLVSTPNSECTARSISTTPVWSTNRPTIIWRNQSHSCQLALIYNFSTLNMCGAQCKCK